ncbi:hypothetical protein ABZZ74_51240 [Streptomyces sp. NPDC006476]|uniref:hypothetical protein n=1 Tax=Streptomyces sp. NPDC006476 TaxID=3157175 RepID=UPI0033BD4963
MDDGAGQGSNDPALWKLSTEPARGGEVVRAEPTAECEAFLAWFRRCLQRGGWPSLTQATADIQENGVERPRLTVNQTTLSRWLKGEHLPRPASLRAVVRALNIHIRTGQDEGELLFVQPVSDAELAEGLRLLAAAQKSREPAQHAYAQAQKELAEAFDGWSQWRAARERLVGHLAEARTTAERLKRLQEGFTDAAADAAGVTAELAEAQRRIHDLEERVAEAERVLENWQDRYDRVYADCEMARETAREERLQMQDDLSAARARAVFATQESAKTDKKLRKLKDRLAETERQLAQARLGNTLAAVRTGRPGGAEGNASPSSPGITDPGDVAIAKPQGHAGHTGNADVPVPPPLSASPGERTPAPSAAPPGAGDGYPIPPPPLPGGYSPSGADDFWLSHLTLAAALVVMAAVSTMLGSGFGQLARAQHNAVWQLAVYSLIAVVVLVGLGVAMFVGMDEWDLLSYYQGGMYGRVGEGAAAGLLFWTGVICTLLAVSLPHWIGVLDGWGGWLQSPLNPD